MTLYTRADWLIPAGLVALSFIPIAAVIFRMVQLGGSAEITPDNARFFAAPLTVVRLMRQAPTTFGAWLQAPALQSWDARNYGTQPITA